mmetsp:Transcript_10255/g.62708  ORF Transcript_10255/g.62708 Transcript_10255/m.62708 type:complete len:140 (+) Transcript_10255:1176-1595(+)
MGPVRRRDMQWSTTVCNFVPCFCRTPPPSNCNRGPVRARAPSTLSRLESKRRPSTTRAASRIRCGAVQGKQFIAGCMKSYEKILNRPPAIFEETVPEDARHGMAGRKSPNAKSPSCTFVHSLADRCCPYRSKAAFFFGA